MVDFSQFANMKAGEAKKPKELMSGNYSAIIKSWEFVQAPAGKNYTSMVRFQLGLLDWPVEAQESDKVQDLGNGKIVPIDLSKRQMRRDFYDSMLYRLDDFIKSCGVELNGRTYNEVLPELVGKRVIAEVKQFVNESTMEIGNNIGELTGEK